MSATSYSSMAYACHARMTSYYYRWRGAASSNLEVADHDSAFVAIWIDPVVVSLECRRKASELVLSTAVGQCSRFQLCSSHTRDMGHRMGA